MYTNFFSSIQISANDQSYVSIYNRTNPLIGSIHHIPNYPNHLIVYKIKASRYWQTRCWIDGKYFKRSTKSQSFKQALRFARFFYEDLLAKRFLSYNNLSINDYSLPKKQAQKSLPFGAIAAQMLINEEARSTRGELSKSGYDTLKNRLDKFILPRWSSSLPKNITYQSLLEFTQYLSINFKTTTISQYLLIVRKILVLAVANGHLEKLPEFPKIKVTSTPRGGFTPSEYWTLLRKARRLIGYDNPHTHPSSNYYIRLNYNDRIFPRDIAWMIGFMVNSFIRPSDIYNLKHKHIEIIHSQNTYLRLTLPESKKHDKPIVTLFPAVRIYQQIVKYQSTQFLCSPDDYIFFPHIINREYARAVLRMHFNWLLYETNLKAGAHGQGRSIYCLRHSAITFRLLYGQGIDLLTLARNSRTSIEMINKYYASSLTGEQNIALLQSRRNTKSIS
jgi:integrase